MLFRDMNAAPEKTISACMHTVRASPERPVVWLCGLILCGLCAQADIRVTRVDVDNTAISREGELVGGAPASRTLRVPGSANTLSIHFTEANRAGDPTARLRYKLEGYDTEWHDVVQEHGMKVFLQFWDSDSLSERRVVGSSVFYLNGETPGWQGAPEHAEFTNRCETVTAPEQARFVKVVIFSDGYLPSIGMVAVDAVRLEISRPGAGGQVVSHDLGVTDINPPLDTVVNAGRWMRWGSMPEMAQVRTRLTPTPHPILVLDDTSARYFAAWATDEKQQPMPVRAGDRLTLSWQVAHSVGGCGPAQADYPRLPPGDYRFRVAAAQANGELTGNELSVPVCVFVPFYYRWGFWLTLIAGAGGVAVWLGQVAVQRRMAWRLTELERQNALERERTRIARDLHDDIGAGLTEIAMLSAWIRRDIAAGQTADTRRRVDRVCQSAVELTRSVDELVWAVNPANDTLDRFASYLSQTTKQFLDAAGLRMRFELPPDTPATPMPGKTRHGLFLAIREALNNAVKHASADLITLTLSLNDVGVRVAIEDNGCGFAPADSEAEGAHEGLENMRRRMDEIGGHFRVVSRLGKGTRAEFDVPLHIPPQETRA